MEGLPSEDVPPGGEEIVAYRRPYFEVWSQWKLPRRQRWYARLVGGNGEIVAASEAFVSKSNADRWCDALARIAGEAVDVRLVDAPRNRS